MKRRYFQFKTDASCKDKTSRQVAGKLGPFAVVLPLLAVAGLLFGILQFIYLREKDRETHEELSAESTSLEEHLEEFMPEQRAMISAALSDPDRRPPEAKATAPIATSLASDDVTPSVEAQTEQREILSAEQIERELEESSKYWKAYLADYSSLRTESVRNPDSEQNRATINAIVEARNARLRKD